MRKADTRKVKFVKDDTLIVAIDVGMEMNHGYCTTPDGRDIKPFKFDNTREGMDKLWGMVMASKNRFKCEEIIVGYESTGPYGEPLVHYLMKKRVMLVQVLGCLPHPGHMEGPPDTDSICPNMGRAPTHEAAAPGRCRHTTGECRASPVN